MSKPHRKRESGKPVLFCSLLDQIIDMCHELAALSREIDWHFLEGRLIGS